MTLRLGRHARQEPHARVGAERVHDDVVDVDDAVRAGHQPEETGVLGRLDQARQGAPEDHPHEDAAKGGHASVTTRGRGDGRRRASDAPRGLGEGTQGNEERDVEEDRQRVEGRPGRLALARLLDHRGQRTEGDVVVPVDDGGARGGGVRGQGQEGDDDQPRQVEEPGEGKGARQAPHRGRGADQRNLRGRGGVGVFGARQEGSRVLGAPVDEGQGFGHGEARGPGGVRGAAAAGGGPSARSSGAEPLGAAVGPARAPARPRGAVLRAPADVSSVLTQADQPPQAACQRAEPRVEPQVPRPVDCRVHVIPLAEGNNTANSGSSHARAESPTADGHTARVCQKITRLRLVTFQHPAPQGHAEKPGGLSPDRLTVAAPSRLARSGSRSARICS